MTEARANRIREIIRYSQQDLGVLLENVHDPHNLGAALRTCDAVGVREVFVLFTKQRQSRFQKEFTIGKKAGSNVRKWIDVRHFTDREQCFIAIRKKYKHIWATHLGEDSVSLYDLNLCDSSVLVFGNEHTGISQESLAHCDGNFTIPMHGFAQSLNVSVSCAIALYEASRQRILADKYQSKDAVAGEVARFEDFAERAKQKHDPTHVQFE